MQDASMPPPPADPEYCVVSRRNNSLRRGQRWTLFASLASASLGIALLFAAAGAWPVLPYSMLEIGVLAGAFAWVERRSRDWERLTVAGDRVFVERAIGGKFSMREWNRAWLRVEVAGMGAGGTSGAPRLFSRGDARLMLRYAGEAIEFGAALPPGERVRVARSLRRLTARWQRRHGRNDGGRRNGAVARGGHGRRRSRAASGDPANREPRSRGQHDEQ